MRNWHVDVNNIHIYPNCYDDFGSGQVQAGGMVMASFFRGFSRFACVTTSIFVLITCSTVQALANDSDESVVERQFQTLVAPGGGSVELVDERTAFSRTLANLDGSRTVEFFGEPVFYESDDGTLIEIDTTVRRLDPHEQRAWQATRAARTGLTRNEDDALVTGLHEFDRLPTFESMPEYGLVADRNSFTVAFGETGDVGYLLEYDNVSLQMRPSNGNIVTASLDHDVVTYSGLWEGAHLIVQVLPDGVKKLIVLESPDAPNEYTFTMNTEGLTWMSTGDRLQFFDSLGGELVWDFQPLFAHDHADEPSLFTDMDYSVRQVGSDIEVTFGIPPQWLNDPARVFPVVIDPKVEKPIKVGDPGTRVGHIELDHDQIVSWEAHLYMPATSIRYAASYAKIGTSRGSTNIAYHEIWGTFFNREESKPKGTFNGKSGSTYYFEVRRGNGWKPFGIHYGTASLTVTYASNESPSTTMLSPEGNWIATARPTFSWRYEDGDGDPQVAFQLQISKDNSFGQIVYDSGTQSMVVPNKGQASWQVPASLPDGRLYWRVRAYDGTHWEEWSSEKGYKEFGLDATPPPIPHDVDTVSGTRYAEIRWQPVDDAVSGTDRYEVQIFRDSSWSDSVNVTHSSGGTLSRRFDGLGDNELVLLRLRSVDRAGNSSSWFEAEAASHAEPTEIVAGEASGDHTGYSAIITVAAAAATDYRLFRDGVPVSPWRPMNSLTYTDHGLAAHQTYQYQVRTRNSLKVEGPMSATLTVTVPNSPPEAPQLILPINEAVANMSQVELVVLPGFDPDLDPLNVHIKLWADGSPEELLFKHSSPQLSAESPEEYAVLTPALRDGVYRWTASITDIYPGKQALDEVESPEIRTLRVDTQPPDAMFDVPSATSSREITLTSIQVSDSGSGIARIEFRNEADTEWTTFTSWETSIPWTLSPGDGPKRVFMRAVDIAGNVTERNRPVTLDTTPPSVPTDLSASGAPGQVTLAWTASHDEFSEPIAYDVDYRRGGGDWVPLVRNGTEPIDTLTGLEDNELVHFRVRAHDQLGNTSEWSSPEPGASLAGVSKIVSSPSGYSLSDGYYIDFALKPVAAEKYQIRLVTRRSPGGSSSDWFPAPTTGETTGIVYRDRDLTAHGTYVYQVVTMNQVGEETVAQEQELTVANQPPSVPEPIGPSPYATSTSVTLQHSPSVDVDGDSITYLYSVYGGSGQVVVIDSDSEEISGLVDGETYTWTVKASDGDLTVEGPPGVFTVDATPPHITVSDPPRRWVPEFAVTIDATDTVSGLASLKYRWNDVGDWIEVLPDTEIAAPHGTNTLHVSGRDFAGNTSALEQVYDVDHTVPFVDVPSVDSVVLPDSGVGVDGNSIFASWNAWDDESGIARYRYGIAPASENDVQLDAAVWWEGTQSPRGNSYSASVTAPFEDGTRAVFVVEATNGVGRVSELQTSLPFTIDKSPPVIEGLTLEGVQSHLGVAYAVSPDAVGLQVAVHDPESGVVELQYALLSQSLIDDSVEWAASVTDLNENVQAGAIRYYAVRAVNGVGMTSTAISSPVRFDSTPPEIGSLLDEGGTTSNRNTFWFSAVMADDESGVIRLRYALGSTPGAADASAGVAGAVEGWITVEMPPSSLEMTLTNLSLSPGTYYVTAEVTNGAGLQTTASSGGVTVDPELPARPVVYDEGAFTAADQSLAAWWLLPEPDGEVLTFRYRILGEGFLIRDWTDVTPAPGSAATSVLATEFSPALEAGVNYIFEVAAEYADGSVSPTGVSNGIQVDTTPPVILSVDDGDFSSASVVKVSWEAVDEESGIIGYRYAVGRVRGGTDVLDWQEAGLATDVSINGLPLEEGSVYYVSIQATNGAGLVTEKTSDGVIIDSTPPPVPFVITPGSYTNKDDQLEASWTFTRSDPESGTVSYAYAIVTHKRESQISNWIDVGTATSVVADGLQLDQGERYFIAVRATNGAGLTAVGFSDGIVVDTTAPDPPRVDNLADYVTDPTSLVADFTALDLESGIRLYTYSLGTYDEIGAIVDGQELAPTGGRDRVTLRGLSLQHGSVYFFRVQALNDAGLLSATGMSTGVLVDTGYPTITLVRDDGDYLTTTNELHAYFESEPSVSNVVEYEVALTADANDSAPDWQSNGLSRLVSFTDLELVDGETYYVFVRARNAAGTWTPAAEWGKSDGIKVDSTPPPAPVVDGGGEFTAGLVTLTWEAGDPESGLSEHRYALGTSRGATDVTGGWQTRYSSDGLQSVQLTDLALEHGRPYYAAVQVRNNAGAWSEPGFSAGVTADLTPPIRPEVTGLGTWTQSRQTLPGVMLTSDDPETGIVAYRYAVIPAGTGPPAFTETRHTTLTTVELDIVGLELSEGSDYQVAVQFQNSVGTWSEVGYSEPFTVDTLPPVITFEQGDVELVTNDGQLAVAYSLNERASLHLQLETPDGADVEELIEIEAPGTYSYAFSGQDEGAYTLTARGVDPAGNVGESVVQRIRVNAQPRVNAGNDVTLRKGQSRTFKGTASDPDGEIVAYEWDFGDGSEPAAGPEVEHLFVETGTYTVTLTATDNDGVKGSDSITVTVVNTSAGTLLLDETWDGEMHLTDDVIVPEHLTLTILPGTVVTVAPGVGLVIRGSAEVGGEGDAVLLQSSMSGTSADPAQLLQATWLWRGIEVVDATGAINFTNATVNDAARGVSDIRSGVQMSAVTFESNVIGVHVFGPSASGTTISEATFRANALYGIKEDGGASVMVVDSHFTENGVGPYYDAVRTVIPIEAINEAPGNGGNH